MNVESLREYCLTKPGTTESFPFDEVTLVFKVMNKMYALIGLDKEQFAVNLKCDPEKAVALREEYPFVVEGWHMHKKYWNTVNIFDDVSDKLVIEMIDHSYDEVIKGLTKKVKLELENLKNNG